MTVIGFGHKARHGKDTCVAAIAKAIPGATRFSFADDLYAVCRVLYGMKGKDPVLLQKVGLFYREVYGPDVWVRSVYSKMLAERPKLALVSDVRFPNEMEFVKQLGGMTVKVERRNEHGDLFVDPSRPADHPSETALNNTVWDVTLINSQTVERLERKAVDLAQRVVGFKMFDLHDGLTPDDRYMS